MENIINTALCSFGMSGAIFHGPLLNAHPGFSIACILERTKELSKEKYNAKIVKNYKEILQDKTIDLVVVNTPDDLHYSMTKLALLSGKHVVVEKPFTQTVEEGEELISLANEQGKILTVFQNRRWDGDYLTVEKIVKSQILGRLVSFEAHFDRFRNYIQDSWKEDNSRGTGTIYNLGPHLIDQVLVLFGMPISVFANIKIFRTTGKVDDYFDIFLEYPDKLALIRASYLVKEAGPRYLIHGTEGSFVKYGLDPQEEALKQGLLPDTKDWGTEPEEKWGILHLDKGEINERKKIETTPGNYLQFYQNLYETINGKSDLLVKPEEALDVIKIIEAAKQSARRGCKILF
ncbi:MAG: oxidoreductase [Bacteroidales bacterium]|nr:oxidoreductase [Bacteroidales bacterium]